MHIKGAIPSGAGFQRIIRILVLFGLIVLPFPRQASADGIHGLLEYIYASSKIKTVDSSGVATNIKSDGLQQRYNLAFDRTLYPSLVFSGGGLYETSFQNGTIDGVDSESNASRLSPYLDLVLKNPFISSGIGYRRREDTSSSDGGATSKNIQDMYSANLGWHPSELPSLDVYYTRRYLYDAQRTDQDIQTDNYTWTSDYRSIKGLELSYNGNYNTLKDNLRNAQTQSMTNSGHIAYSGTLLNNRVFYHSSYNISMQNSTITANGAAGATFFLPPQGIGVQLFAVTPTEANVTTVTNGALLPSTATVNLVAPLTSPATQYNIGLSFISSPQMDTVFLSITTLDTTVTPPVSRVPTAIDLKNFYTAHTDLFPFKIYTSQNGTNWVPSPGGITPTVTVGINPSNPASEEVGFIISFPQQTTNYIKVVQTPPLVSPTIPNHPSTIDPKNILAVNIQAFKSVQITTPGTSISASTIGGIYDMNVKALLLDNPNLSYDMTFSFAHNKSDQSPLTTTYQMNNGLSISRRLGEIWSVNGRVTEEFTSDSQSRIRNAFSYNAGVTVTPLPTLNHSLVYGGRIEFFEGQRTLSNSIYLNNSAELYKGLSVNLGTGYSTGTQASGQSSDSVTLTVGTEIVPNRNFTMSLSFQSNDSHQTGGGQADQTSFNRTATASATYRPFEAVYLTAGYSIFMQNAREDVTLHNYGVSWSPFRGGDLQFNFAYSESFNSGANEKDRNISPSLRWNIRPGSTLDVSYSMLNSNSGVSGSTNSKSIGAQLRITF